MSQRFDRHTATAEARLERLDDTVDEREPGGSSPLTVEDRHVVTGDDSIHIEDEWFPAADDGEEEARDDRHTELTNCIEAFVDAFNARDLDGVLELTAEDCEAPGLGNDVDHFPEAVEDLWERRPSIIATLGTLSDGPVGVAWELGEDELWWPVATLHFSDVEDGRAGVIAFSTDQQLLEAVESDPPDGDIEEGMRWSEWDEGAGS